MSALHEILVKNLDAVKESPDAIGEILRKWAFARDGYGCYSTFDVRPEFESVTPSYLEFSKIMGRPYSPSKDHSYGWDDTDDEIMQRMSWFKHPNGIEMGWYWDGDGTLCFYVPELEDDFYDGTVTNDDCKKSHGWEFGTHTGGNN